MSEHAEKVKATVETYDGISALVASWRRCLQIHRLDPDHAVAPRQDLAAWRAACQGEKDTLEIGRPVLDQLFRMLSDADCAVFLTDLRGMVLDLRTNRAFDTWMRTPDQWYGTIYSEDRVGTNSIGTCIAEQRAVIVRGDQHFLTRYADRTGISAPLFGPEGALAGSLTINQNRASHDARLDAFLSLTVANFARRIEAEMFARAHPAARLILASPQGRAPEALLAVDHDDRVVGATRGARRLLSLGDDAIAGAPNVDDIFESGTTPRGDILADAERRAIVRALSRVGGNLSAAARLIGISRSTLYRKLACYDIGASRPSAGPAKPRLSA